MTFNIPKEKTAVSFENIKGPLIMGILNVTPDSFYDGGRYIEKKEILKRAEQIINEGGNIIDIGAYSSRASAKNISEEEEIRRLIPSIELILGEFPSANLSIDTFRSKIAKRVVKDYEVKIINDISGGTLDKDMFTTIAELDVWYVLMHMKGTPQNMQNKANTTYNDTIKDVFIFFSNKINRLNELGFRDIIIDPGFGFAKTTEQNFELLKNLSFFCTFELPILAGMSRKTMLWETLQTKPENCLNGTTVVNTMALMNGAKILRVHDVKEAKETITLFEKYNNA